MSKARAGRSARREKLTHAHSPFGSRTGVQYFSAQPIWVVPFQTCSATKSGIDVSRERRERRGLLTIWVKCPVVSL